MMTAKLLAAVLLLAATSADALLVELQRAVGRDDRRAVAALIRYPITVATAGVRIPIRDPDALVQTYDAVFTPELKAAIRDGSALRNGLIKVTPIRGDVKITAISAPYGTHPSAGADGDRSASRRSPSPSKRSPPRRVTFAVVQQMAQLSGSLSPGTTDAFVAYVEKGRLLEARIDGVRGRAIVLKVLDAKTGKPLDAKAAAGARTWIGRVPESADYRIDVRRLEPAGDPSMPYVLVVRRR